jgi:hypothetical protein
MFMLLVVPKRLELFSRAIPPLRHSVSTIVNSTAMDKKNVTIIILLLLGCILSGILIYTSIDMKTKMNSVASLRTTSMHRLNEYKVLGERLSDSIYIFDDNNKMIQIDSIFIKNRILIYYFSTTHCNMCYETQLELINEVYGSSNSNVMIIAKSENYKNLKIIMNNHNIEYPLYMIKSSLVPMLDSLRVPYYCLIDSNRIISTYIPQTEYTNHSIQYLKSTNKILDNNN